MAIDNENLTTPSLNTLSWAYEEYKKLLIKVLYKKNFRVAIYLDYAKFNGPHAYQILTLANALNVETVSR